MLSTLFLTQALLLSPVIGAHAAVLERLEATVNSSQILFSDVVKFRQTTKLRAQLDPLFAGTSVAQKGSSATDSEIINFLIDEKVITQAFPIADTEVEQEITSIQANNKIDRNTLRSALKEQGFAFEDYFELIRASASKRNLIERDIRTKVTVSDDDVKNYFFNHFAKKSSAPIAYKLQLISVSTKNYKTPGAAREVVARALKDVRGGEAFEEVAKRASDGPTAANGGDLGTLNEDQISPVIREQVKKLQIGQTSEVFGSASAGGFYIVRIADMKSSENERLEKMKEELRGQLAAGEYQHQISLWLERQRQTAYVHRAGQSTLAGAPIAPSQK